MNKQEQLDVGTLLTRLMQMRNASAIEVLWLWVRILDNDIPRLKAYIVDPEIQDNFNYVTSTYLERGTVQ